MPGTGIIESELREIKNELQQLIRLLEAIAEVKYGLKGRYVEGVGIVYQLK